MLEMVKGCIVPFPDKLIESYEIKENSIIANVNANKIEEILNYFIMMNDEPQFFILEIPTNEKDEEKIETDIIKKFHKDVYYIDGCNQEKELLLLHKFGEILINDGLCYFGFGCHNSHDEIMVNSYNIITIYSNDIEKYNDFFKQHKIPKVESVVTAWDTFSYEHPGMSISYCDADGEDIYSILETFKEWGLYFAEKREE